jgi:hypothetical protein
LSEETEREREREREGGGKVERLERDLEENRKINEMK